MATDQEWVTEKWGSIDANPIVIWLENRGFKENAGTLFLPDRAPSDEEWRAVLYLCDEWDFSWRTL